jgi:hypothetical protein
MAAKPLDIALVERVLSTVASVAREFPNLPALKHGVRGSVVAIAKRRLLDDTREARGTWESRFFHVRDLYPDRWTDALAGRFSPARGAEVARTAVAGITRRYLLTAAQDETSVHLPFWRNLLAYGTHLGAEVMVAGFTYNKSLFEDHAARSGVFAEVVRPYLRHDNVELSPEILFAAKMNTLPTAVKPLSGLETYTQGRWGVFPHAKVQLVSVPALNGRHPAMLMTTGACTMPNYVEKKAGLKAEFHHVFGATIVEIDAAGRTFCRQLMATEDGSFQDLDVKVKNGKVTNGHRIEAITFGDIHRPKIDPVVAMACWGLDVEIDKVVSANNMLDVLRPRHAFYHDLIDFFPRNHHRRGDHAHAYKMLRDGATVDGENAMCARFLRQTARDWCTSVVARSNHDEAMPRWLREADPRQDPINALFWFKANAAIYEALERGDDAFDVIRWALARHDEQGLDDIVFVPRDGSYVICQAHGGIECSLHGDEGPNGTRGSATNLARVATRMNVGHAHTAAIFDGVFIAGLCGVMDQGYNSGPSSWSHTQTVTYASSKRTLITLRDGHWRAP